MNKVLELQKVIVNSAKKIEFLKKNKINIFTSIPNGIKQSYIKIAGIALNNQIQNVDIQNFTIDLFVSTNGKNNSHILEIMNCLFLELSNKIYEYISIDNEMKKFILNIYNIKYDISEELQSDCWNGHFYVDIDII